MLEKMLFWILGTFVLDTLEVDWAFDSRHKADLVFLRGYSWLEANSGQSISYGYLDVRLGDYFSVKAKTPKEHALKSSGSFSNVLLEDLLKW